MGIKSEKIADKVITEPILGQPCIIEINGKRYKTSPVEDFFHFHSNQWVIKTLNTIYRIYE